MRSQAVRNVQLEDDLRLLSSQVGDLQARYLAESELAASAWSELNDKFHATQNELDSMAAQLKLSYDIALADRSHYDRERSCLRSRIVCVTQWVTWLRF